MSKLTPDQVAQLTPNGKILHHLMDAMLVGDEETAKELRKQLVYPAEALLVAKRNMGADWIKKEGLRTEAAEQKYGKDWLNREI